MLSGCKVANDNQGGCPNVSQTPTKVNALAINGESLQIKVTNNHLQWTLNNFLSWGIMARYQSHTIEGYCPHLS